MITKLILLALIFASPVFAQVVVAPSDAWQQRASAVADNEAQASRSIKRSLEEILKHVGCDVLVVDDNSPDGTGRWCDEHRALQPRLKCLHRPGKLGLGTAILAGMRYAIEQGYTHVVNMDAEEEGRIAIVEKLEIGQETVTGSTESSDAYLPLWPYAIGLCLAVLMFEWWVYHRKTYL